jgi:acyl-CoA thioesterase
VNVEGDDLARRVAARMYESDFAAHALAISLESVREGAATVSMTVRRDMLNSHAIAHGGFVFTLADTAFAYACNSRNEVTVALQCSISFASAAREGELLRAHAEERTRTKRTSTYDVTVTDAAGEVVALFRGTAYKRSGTVI